MGEASQSPAAIFLQLRSQLLRPDLVTAAPAPDGTPAEEADPIGVAMEFVLGEGSCFVFGLRDGSASVYLSTGGGFIGGQGLPPVNAAAKKLVAAARPLLARFTPASELQLAVAGKVRFWVITASGLRTAEADDAELHQRRGDLLPLFAGAHGIITAFRVSQGDESEAPDEPMYVNYLLVAIARGSTSSVTLREGEPPPDPSLFTNDEKDLKEIAETGFDFNQLSTAKIIRLICSHTKFPLFSRKKGRFVTRLLGEGGSSSMVEFDILRSTRDGRAELTIQRIG